MIESKELKEIELELNRLNAESEEIIGSSSDAEINGMTLRFQGMANRITELEKRKIRLEARINPDPQLPHSRPQRSYDSSTIYRSPQPELAEPILDRNPRPDSKVWTFIHRLGHHTELCTLVGIDNLIMPIEMFGNLTKGERLAAYLSKGSLSWTPSDLAKFGRNYVGFPEFFMVSVYENARSRFPKDESLESIDDIDPEIRERDLYRRLKDIPTIVRIEFKKSFLARVEGFHEAYGRAAYIDRPKRTQRIYDAITSPSS